MDGIIFKCPCCEYKCVGTEDQTEVFKCKECGHDEWEKVGQMIEFEQFYYVDDGKTVHVSKLTREQRITAGLPVPDRNL